MARRLAAKYTFGYFSVEDIKQEAFLIAFKALESYDESRPLENFLAVSINNRLKTFKRDNYGRQTSSKFEIKKHIMNPLDIDNVNGDNESNMSYHDTITLNYEIDEILTLIDTHLDVKLRPDYLRLKSGVHIKKSRKYKIEKEIQRILTEHGYESW